MAFFIPAIPYVLAATAGALAWNSVDDAVVDPFLGNKTKYTNDVLDLPEKVVSTTTLVVVAGGLYLAHKKGLI